MIEIAIKPSRKCRRLMGNLGIIKIGEPVDNGLDVFKLDIGHHGDAGSGGDQDRIASTRNCF